MVSRNRVFCGTYNVNDAMPKDATHLSSWVEDAKDAELLVFGSVPAGHSDTTLLAMTDESRDLLQLPGI